MQIHQLIDFNHGFLSQFDTTWSLFLDRDGVINDEVEDDYVRNWESFRFLEGSLASFPIFAKLFAHIFIVTNQKGVGKGLMSENDLIKINEGIVASVNKEGGFINKIYYCTATENTAPCRKPNNGMALQAQKDFPNTIFSRSIMIGNTLSDMQFGKSVGMTTVFVASKKPKPEQPHPLIDIFSPDLITVAKVLQKKYL
ncbi:MAG: HAD-IIIA family hydrolase [Chitinophagaceae bacterium]|nr:HAD-IIIA family hydrolase [Chitinophagaceae bacterium]